MILKLMLTQQLVSRLPEQMRRSPLQLNMIANLAGRGWEMVLVFALVPLYLRFLGMEAYALVGVFAALQGLANLLDLGLSQTMNREMARCSADAEQAQSARDLVRTLEVGYWAVGLVIAAMVLVSAPWIAYNWVQVKQLSQATVEQAVVIMGVVLAVQWPLSFYAGGLVGLQRQVLWSTVNALMATVRGFGSVLVLWLVAPTIQAFFIWQVFTSLLHTGLAVGLLWSSLPVTKNRSRIRWTLFTTIWRFAAGMSATTLVSLLLSQMDKVLLSRFLVLESFGYYILSSTLTVGFLMVPVAPVTDALFPRLTHLLARGETTAMIRLYHQGAQLISVVVWPAAIVLAYFAQPVLQLWTRDSVIATQAHWIVSLMAISTALQAMMSVPYMLQLAYGWTRLGFYQNAVSLMVLLPIMLLLTSRYQAAGAASAWLLILTLHLVITPQIMFRRLLKGEKWRWYRDDIGRPLIAALGVSVVGKLLLSDQLPVPWLVAGIALVLGGAWLSAVLAASQIRDLVLSALVNGFRSLKVHGAGLSKRVRFSKGYKDD